jgi:hypothetical protein
MASIYASQVKEYGRSWYRPWSVLVIFLTLSWALQWLVRDNADEAQVVCEHLEGSRYRAAVEIDGLVWTADMDTALACAVKHDRRVLVAFHAITDTNARLHEVTIFRDQRAQSAMRRYVLVMLQIDFVSEHFYLRKPDQEDQRKDGEANLEFEQQIFNTVQEPLYVVLQPKGSGEFEIVGEFDEGQINEPTRFVQFLRNPAAWPDGFWRNAMNKLRQFARVP